MRRGQRSPFHVMRLPWRPLCRRRPYAPPLMRRRTAPRHPIRRTAGSAHARSYVHPHVLAARRGRVGKQARGVARPRCRPPRRWRHVPQRDGRPRGHAAAHHLHGPGVGARAGRHRLDLVRMPCRRAVSSSRAAGGARWRPGRWRAPAHLDDVVLRQPRRRAETDVHGDGRVRHVP